MTKSRLALLVVGLSTASFLLLYTVQLWSDADLKPARADEATGGQHTRLNNNNNNNNSGLDPIHSRLSSHVETIGDSLYHNNSHQPSLPGQRDSRTCNSSVGELLMRKGQVIEAVHSENSIIWNKIKRTQMEQLRRMDFIRGENEGFGNMILPLAERKSNFYFNKMDRNGKMVNRNTYHPSLHNETRSYIHVNSSAHSSYSKLDEERNPISSKGKHRKAETSGKSELNEISGWGHRTEEINHDLTTTEDYFGSVNRDRVPSSRAHVATDEDYTPISHGNKEETTEMAKRKRPASIMQEFSYRRKFVKRRCQEMSQEQLYPESQKKSLHWITSRTKELFICPTPKVGFASWTSSLKNMWNPFILNGRHVKPVTAITVRHPLARLVSAYRDKFLKGAPLSAYDQTWREHTKSTQTWQKRWVSYWLPALISTRRLVPTPEFILALQEITKIYRRNAVFGGSVIGRKNPLVPKEVLKNMYAVPTNASVRELRRRQIQGMAEMLGKQYVKDLETRFLTFCVRSGYSATLSRRLQEEFKNTSFTFQEFLDHVVWSFQFGLMDYHWQPYQWKCSVCSLHYDYILKLENIGDESSALFENLGYPSNITLSHFHDTQTKEKSISHNSGYSKLSEVDLKYYAGISNDTMKKLSDLYYPDFVLFEYYNPWIRENATW